NAVKENRLSHPSVVPDHDVLHFITVRGKGWVSFEETVMTGFAIADLEDNNIWALFVLPEYEGLGIGRALQRVMLDWYFSQTRETVWLGTAPGTRAEGFYAASGWRATGLKKNGEAGFELRYEDWQRL
ncbi:MAG: GNAT family N-acetyltransferase, partial [Bacteroidetes bacterium]|nr:GNAT family N-acetyltransferase [Bacteroidota bacterium]